MTDIEPHARSTSEQPRAVPRGRQVGDTRSDVRLLSAARQGDGAAFGEFYLRHAGRLFAYYRPRCSNSQDAYDLVSEAFAQAFQSLAEFDPERGEPGGWLFGIARNKYRHYVRRGAVETRGRQRMELNVGHLSPDELDRLEQSIDLSSVQQHVAPAITALPDTLRDAVRLRCIDGYDYDAIATHLGVRPATARKRVSRGLRQLNDSLGEHNPFRSHD